MKQWLRGFRTFFVKIPPHKPHSDQQPLQATVCRSGCAWSDSVSRSSLLGRSRPRVTPRPARLYLWSLWKAAEKSFAWRWAIEWRYFVLDRRRGVWSHQRGSKHSTRQPAAEEEQPQLLGGDLDPVLLNSVSWGLGLHLYICSPRYIFTYMSTYTFTYVYNVHLDIYIASPVYMYSYTHIYIFCIYILHLTFF